MTGQPIQDSREAIINAVIDSLGAYSKTIGQGRAGIVFKEFNLSEDSRSFSINFRLKTAQMFQTFLFKFYLFIFGFSGLLAPKEGHLKYFPQYALSMLKHVGFKKLLLEN